ncbi:MULTISPECIES: CZB domain-containing protein [Citrobacter]|uniref:CZB domain-containing protein n=1 Tax=Citrobacter TaxID=544 RepID=UPI0015E18B6A|nr:CZB domain-containing protein [Citrobacter braakii]MBJ9240205.1 CZB domain-containing protein [Citrobacter braakii]WAD29378.1 CZB domain-containing protein [Citrobacter braakii]
MILKFLSRLFVKQEIASSKSVIKEPEFMNKFDNVLEQLRPDSSVSYVAFVDMNSGMKLASVGLLRDGDALIDCSIRVMRAELKTIKLLEVNDDVLDILITTDDEYQLLYPCRGMRDIFIYLVASRERANLALLKRNISDVEANLISIMYTDGDIQNHGFNVKSALDAHCRWRDKLINIINGTDTVTNLNELGMDDRCELGQWLHTVGQNQYGSMSEFQELMKLHHDFHRCVQEVVDMYIAEGVDSAKCELTGNFQKRSALVQEQIVHFFDNI